MKGEIRVLTGEGIATTIGDEDLMESYCELIEKIEKVLTENEPTSAIVDDMLHMDFECENVSADALLLKVEELMKTERWSFYEFEVAERFSDETAFCTLKIAI